MKADKITYAKTLEFLSECLEKYHKQKAIILIDEYDIPLENAYFSDFYDEMLFFIRWLFASALKTNDNLEFAVVAGCLRISRESICTGLNNLEAISIPIGIGVISCMANTSSYTCFKHIIYAFMGKVFFIEEIYLFKKI